MAVALAGFYRRDIVVRKADHQLDVRATEQWSHRSRRSAR
jgi:hypothetical protein